MKTFFVGRYYFDSLFRKEANDTFLEDILKNPSLIEGNTGYALAKVEKFKEGNEEFIKGVFVKYKLKNPIQQYIKESNDLDNLITEDVVESQIEFFLHHPTHLLFIEKSSKLKEDLFVTRLQRIYKQNSSVVADMDFDFLFQEKDVYKEIKSWDRVVKAIFTNLRPSNPRTDPHFENIEALLKEACSSTTRMEFKTNDTSEDATLNTDSTLIKESLSLSSHGYGHARFIGKHEGKEKQVSTAIYKRTISINFLEPQSLASVIEEVSQNQDGEV